MLANLHMNLERRLSAVQESTVVVVVIHVFKWITAD